MFRLIALAAAVAAAAVTATAGADHAVTKQRIAIAHNGGSFVVTPLTPGSVKRDTGIASFCCWSDRHTIRDGQAIEINDPEMTLTGKLGTLVARNRIGWVDVSDGWSLFTGTWKIVHGTGQYAGLAGGGRGAGIQLSTRGERARFEGFVGTR
jgi:hypothetical protein